LGEIRAKRSLQANTRRLAMAVAHPVERGAVLE